MNKEWRNFIVFVGIFLMAIFIVWFMFSSDNNKPTITGEIIADNEEVGEDVKIENTQIEEIKDDFSNIEELHWTHMPLTYRINFTEYDNEIKKLKIQNVKYGLERIHNAIPYVDFVETNDENEDILFLGEIPTKIRVDMCNTGECNSDGLAIPNYSGEYISHSIIYLPELLKNDPDFYSSSGSDTEVHEILHVFGIDHSNVIGGVMFPSNSGMRKNIEDNIISCLKKIYSNGEFDGDCSKVNFSSNKVSCEEGWYEVEGTDYCCPEPNMKIVDGYCV